jgi:multidrug efflux pump
MLVDNAIVIIENIHRFIEQGASRVEAAMKATSEVAYPVIGSTLTTVSAFIPMLFWSGIMGEFMRFLPLTLIVTLSSSLFVALVINPALASLLHERKTGRKQSRGRFRHLCRVEIQWPSTPFSSDGMTACCASA